MEWSTESIEKVICFVQEHPFLFDESSAELAWRFDARNLLKKLVQVSWLCVTTISQVCSFTSVRGGCVGLRIRDVQILGLQKLTIN